MRPALRITVIALTLGMWLAYTNCSRAVEFKTQGTTITGNPMAPVSNEIMFALCAVINRCNPQVTAEKCQAGLLATSGFSTPLGLSSTYTTYSSIVQGETSGALVGNQTAAASCFDAINALSCSDPSVVGAYNGSLSNPFSGTPNAIPAASCSQSFSPGVNLEVPIELVGHGLVSNTTSTTFLRTRTSLNTADYDGTVSYTFEIVANNTDPVTRNVTLLDSSGASVAVITVPNVGSTDLTWGVQRYQVSFTPTSGANDYRIMLDGTTSSGQMLVTAGRIRIKQIGATQTKIYVPMMQGSPYLGPADATDLQAYLDDPTTSTYFATGWSSLWKKNNSAFSQLAATNPWTFEAVLSAAPSSTAYASLFDASTGLQVTASEISTAAAVPTLVSQSFADGATNFNDLDTMRVNVKAAGSAGYIYRAGLWIKLVNLSHAEVYYQNLGTNGISAGSGVQDLPYNRVMIDTTLFTSPSVYFQSLGNADSAGTVCPTSAFDNGTTDSLYAGSIVAGSTLTFSSTTPSLQRSPPLNVTSGHRYTVSFGPNTGPGTCSSQSSFLVIGF